MAPMFSSIGREHISKTLMEEGRANIKENLLLLYRFPKSLQVWTVCLAHTLTRSPWSSGKCAMATPYISIRKRACSSWVVGGHCEHVWIETSPTRIEWSKLISLNWRMKEHGSVPHQFLVGRCLTIRPLSTHVTCERIDAGKRVFGCVLQPVDYVHNKQHRYSTKRRSKHDSSFNGKLSLLLCSTVSQYTKTTTRSDYIMLDLSLCT